MSKLKTKQSENVSVDLLKALFALGILALHTNCFGEYNTYLVPIYRIGVPFFFVISSYFFFKKIAKTPEREQKSVLWKYIQRNLLLYVFWFVCSLPFVYNSRYASIFEAGFLKGVLQLIQNALFSSTWMASWYIMATVIGTVIIYFLSKFLKNNALFILAFLVYLLCCFCCTWYNLFPDDSFVHSFRAAYTETTNGVIYNSFPVSLVWITIGKIFAEKKVQIKWPYMWVILSGIFLFAEYFVVTHYGLQRGNNSDSLLMLLPVTAILVYIALNRNILHFPGGKFLRAYSVIVFCTQGIWIVLINAAYAHFDLSGSTWWNVAKFGIAAVCSLLLTGIILLAQKCKALHFLKYAY